MWRLYFITLLTDGTDFKLVSCYFRSLYNSVNERSKAHVLFLWSASRKSLCFKMLFLDLKIFTQYECMTTNLYGTYECMTTNQCKLEKLNTHMSCHSNPFISQTKYLTSTIISKIKLPFGIILVFSNYFSANLFHT